LLVLAAVLLRADSFGDPVAHSVDQFYLLVGERMHHGLLPYVDIWDRKPPGIFFLYFLIAGVSTSAVCFQLIAALFAGATAVVVARISGRWSGRTGAVLAGLIYLVMLGDFNGNTGEAAVFYNLPVGLAVWWLTGEADRRKFDLAMLALGLAITVKQTVAVEAAVLGIAAVCRLDRRDWLRNVLRFVALGIAPTALFAGYFLLAGHFTAYWDATVVSIFMKGGPSAADTLGRSLELGRRFIPLAALALLGFILKAPAFGPHRRLMLAWTVAAIVGVLAIPQLYLHYGQSLVLPLAVVASVALDRRISGLLLAALAIFGSLIYHRPFQFARHAQSRAEMADLTRSINALPGDTMLVFDGPSALYTLTGRRFLTPLVFPPHLNHRIELNVSGIDTNREIARVLALVPDVIVMAEQPRNQPANEPGWNLVRTFTAAHCRLAASKITHEMGSQRLLVFDCTSPAANRQAR
jgi:hypothetical protein